MLRYAALLIVALTAVPTVVLAETESGTPEERRACRGDFLKFCKHVPDEMKIEIANCLASHRAPPGAARGQYLSAACDAVLKSHGF
jgi:hypothetical protein